MTNGCPSPRGGRLFYMQKCSKKRVGRTVFLPLFDFYRYFNSAKASLIRRMASMIFSSDVA